MYSSASTLEVRSCWIYSLISNLSISTFSGNSFKVLLAGYLKLLKNTIVSTEYGASAGLESEYNIKAQLGSAYDLTTQIYTYKGYKLKLINSSIFQVISQPPAPNPLPNGFKYEYELDQLVRLSDLGIYPSFGYFEENIKKPLLYEELRRQFSVTGDIEISTFDTYYDTNTKVFRTSAYFTWTGHGNEVSVKKPTGEVAKVFEKTYEYIFTDYDSTPSLYDMYYTEKFEKRFFIEYTINNVRYIYKGNNFENFVTKTNKQKIEFMSVLPIKRYLPTDETTVKRLDRALIQGNYKSKYKKKKPKIPANKLKGMSEEQKKNAGKDIVTMMNDQGSIDEADISQYLDFSLFFKKDIRSDKMWQKYLKVVMEYFDKTLGFGLYHRDAPRHNIYIDTTLVRGPNKFKMRVQGVRRLGRFLKTSKICFISTEPQSGDCYLYLNVPDWSLSTPTERSQGIFYNFVQYGINLSYWYSSERIESFNFYGRDMGSQRENRNDLYRTNLNPAFYLDVNVDEYMRLTGEHWVNNGEILDPQLLKPKKYQGDDVYETFHIEETKFTYDDRVDYIHPYVGEIKDEELNLNMDHLCLMPVKLWRKVPYVAKVAVFQSTLFLYYQYSWEEKKGTILGKIGGVVLAIIGIVVIVFNFYNPAAWGWGLSLIGSGTALLGAMLNNQVLSRIGSIIGIIGGLVGGISGLSGSLLQQFAGVMAIVGSVVVSWNFLTAMKNEQVLKNLAEKTKEETDKIKKEGKTYEDYKKGFLNLTKYNIDIDTGEGIEDMYTVATAQHCYAMLDSGKYYQVQEQDYKDIYERY